YGLRPARTTGPTGLVQTVEYDQRTFQPKLIVDAQGNRTVGAYTPLGMLERVARLGQEGRQEGDTLDQPGVVYTYGISAWDDSPPSSRQPTWVDVRTRVQYRWEVVD